MPEPLPADVRRLVIAARCVVFEGQGREAMLALDKASEEFADRVPWDNEPEEIAAGDLCFDCPPANYPTDKTRCKPCPRAKTAEAALSRLLTDNDQEAVDAAHAVIANAKS